MVNIERVYLINLRRRPDRLRMFFRNIKKHGWPFQQPIIYPAIDGSKVGVPLEFTEGAGAYGCRMSHLRILQDCLMDDVQTVLIVEDDAEIRDGFAQNVTSFFEKVPDDWEGIMLGGQHVERPRNVCPGVVRVVNAQRTHAYIANNQYMRALQERWGNSTVHIDWRMNEWQKNRIIYAPKRWLVGQSSGMSDIQVALNESKWWNDGEVDTPIVPASTLPPIILLRSPREVMEALQTRGLYSGKKSKRDKDAGYSPILAHALKDARRKYKIREWLRETLPDCIVSGSICTLWCPEMRKADVLNASNGVVYEITAESVDEALDKLPDDCRKVLDEFFKRDNVPPVVILDAPKSVIDEMKKTDGWVFVENNENIKFELRQAVLHGKVVVTTTPHVDDQLQSIQIKAKSYSEVIEQWIA